MARKLNIVIIHGVGWGESRDHFADELKDNIAASFEQAIFDLDLDDLPDHTEQKALRIAPVYWSPVTQDPQNELIDLLGIVANQALFGKTTAEIQRQMIGLVGDIIAYGDPIVYKAIHAKIDEAVTHLSVESIGEREDDGYANLTMVGHSLGSVIASDYIYDHRDREHDWRWRMPNHHLKLKNIFLLGSPMAMYTLRGNPGATREQIRTSLDRPVQVDPHNGFWLNMHDPQDPIGLPLSPIESYQKEGVIDCPVEAGNWLTGWNAASHVGYWRSTHVAEVIGHKLALDWAALNSPSFADTYYDQEVAALRDSLGK
jgi:pimeloyl-ACP methyl ester carboxylesterase